MNKLLNRITSNNGIKNFSNDELISLSNEIREFIINSVCRTGGHLGVNTGIIEISVALHYVFDSPKDKFIWDVGHQVYVHKILTGRAHTLATMRQDGGSPGFPDRNESEHDLLDMSHGGTSLSLAAGISLSNSIKGIKNYSIAIIGDSALGEGMALEALNQIGYEKPNIIIIINDNGWGITENKTALKTHLASKTYDIKDSDPFFESLGFKYFGPVNGHDINSLIDVLNSTKDLTGPIIIHTKTKKGNGLSFPDDNICQHHFCFPLDLNTGLSLIHI